MATATTKDHLQQSWRAPLTSSVQEPMSEEIARLAGHSSTRTTEVIYRRELRPVLTRGAEAMDAIFE
jgi:hypothetical protein